MLRGSRGKDLLCLALLLAFAVVLCQGLLRGQAGLGPAALIDGDVLYGTSPSSIRQYDDRTPIQIEAPRDWWLAERVRAGHLDLWNPLQGGGVPLPPDHGGIFSPLRLLHVLFLGPIGYALFHCVRLWIAAAGTFYLARQLELSRPAALTAGVVFGFGGGMIALLPFVSAGPVCVLPWLLLAQGELLRHSTALGRALVGLAAGCTLTAGHPTIAATVLVGCIAHGLACVASAASDRRRGLLDLAVGWALGVALAAPFLLPFAEFLAHGHTYKQIARGLGDHLDSLDFTRASFGPAIAGPSTLDAIRDAAPGRGYPSSLDFVAGTAAWLLGCVGVLRRRVPAPLLVLGAIGFLLSFEPPPLDRAVTHVPMLRDILPRYYWQLAMLPVACAAGCGVDALTSGRRALRGIAIAAALFACVALAGLGVSTFATVPPKVWGRIVADFPPSQPGWLLYHVIVLGSLALVACAIRLGARRGACALLFIVAADVLFLMHPHVRERPSTVLRSPLPPPVLQLASDLTATHSRMSGASPATSVASFPLLAGLADFRMTAPLVPDRYYRFLVATGFDERSTNSCCAYYLAASRSPWAELAAVRFIVADRAARETVASDPMMSVSETLPLSTVFENHAAFGRARLFFGATVADSEEDAISKLRPLAQGGAHIDATSLGKTVILEPAGRDVPGPLAGEGSADVRWIRDDPGDIVVETDGAAPGYLMLADVYYPGWRASVDGTSVPIFPADVGFRAVQVAPGRHRVRFVYRPLSMWSGVALAAAALIAALMGIKRERSRVAG